LATSRESLEMGYRKAIAKLKQDKGV
ncbi:carbonate dehydratase, partial [Serratia sp. CY85251]